MGKAKLVTVYTLDNQTAYATFGYIGFVGALAGMSHAGITVSQTNLDNAMVNFDGIAWPVRLRQLLAEASTLEDAETLWSANSNTAAFNFLGTIPVSPTHSPAVHVQCVSPRILQSERAQASRLRLHWRPSATSQPGSTTTIRSKQPRPITATRR